MSHYFIEDKNIKSDPCTYSYEFNGRRFAFTTDSGVFSKGRIDHATDLLLRNIPALSGSLLDMGCGNGCIGIVLASAYCLTLTQADVNPTALRLTSLNCANNKIASHIVLSDCFSNIVGGFDTIVINPPIHAGKNTMYTLYEESRAHLNENGKLYIVIQKKHGAESTLDKLRTLYDHCVICYKKKGYYVVETGLK